MTRAPRSCLPASSTRPKPLKTLGWTGANGWSPVNPNRHDDIVLESGHLQHTRSTVVRDDLVSGDAAADRLEPLNLKLPGGERHSQRHLARVKAHLRILII